MTRDDVIRMAHVFCPAPDYMGDYSFTLDELEGFAALVEEASRATEREACARLCEGIANVCTASSIGKQRQGGVSAANGCAEMIRARGKA